jgi:hypothetical protein
MRREVFKKVFVRFDADNLGNGRQGLQDVSRAGTHQRVCLYYD